MAVEQVLNEEEFLNAVKIKSPRAAGYLYDTYAITLHKIIWINLTDKLQAEDILEKTFQTIWETIGDHREPKQRLSLWMACIARKLAKETTAPATIVYKLKELEEPGEDAQLALS